MTNWAAAKEKISAGGCLFKALEVIDDRTPGAAAYNMAADEALLEECGDCPVLRTYRWLRPAISFGYFTPCREVCQPDSKREFVRRWTGGGIVEHGEDFTYSLVIPRADLARFGNSRRAYGLIHQALARALVLVGVETNVVDETVADGGNTAISRDAGTARRVETGRCFENPVAHDLMAGAHKAAGAAQRRTRRGLLHQGSVQGLVAFEAAPAPADWRARLADTLPKILCALPARRSLTPAEKEYAKRLVETKYGTREWLEKF